MIEEDNIQRVRNEIRRLTYPQDWVSYNLAKTQERILAERILFELLDSITVDEVKVKVGRPEASLRSRIYAMFIYTYCRHSSRRSISELRIAKDRKLISAVPHFNTVLNYFSNVSLTPILKRLVYLTALPLRNVERDFAVDSSGFSTSLFERWLNIRTQKIDRKRHWKKAHIIIGVKSNVIASVEVTDGTAADSSEFIRLVEQASSGFHIREVSADKAYLSRENFDSVAAIGAIPYIPFKSNTIRNSRGSRIWSLMFEYFLENKDRFLLSYHKRSNVETVFHMLKRNFGNSIKTRKDEAQINEILMKCLCHNLNVLVQESFELGLDLDFAQNVG